MELHRIAGREQDRLLLQDQDQIAAALGFADADALMAAVSAAGRQIAWVSDDVWRRRRLWDPTPPPRRRFRRRRPAPGAGRSGHRRGGPDMVDIDGEIALAPTAAVSEDTSLAFRLAATAAELDRPIAKGSLHRLADRMPPPADSVAARGPAHALVRLLAPGGPAIDKLESLDQHGLLVRLIPEWAAVRNKPQRNAYHTYTVDRHLLEAAALASELTDSGRTAGPPAHRRAAARHRQGLSRATTPRSAWRSCAGWPPAWASSPTTSRSWSTWCATTSCCPTPPPGATSTTPTTVANVARAAGNRLTLHLLGALTEADSRATGPSAWGSWKAGLVADLVERADRELAGEAMTVRAGAHGHGLPRADGRGSRQWAALGVARPTPGGGGRTGPPGLLSAVAGALALHGMDVRAANVSGEDGVAVEVFTVEVARGTWPDTARLREDLAAVLSDPMAIGERLTERGRVYPARRRSAAHLPGTDVRVDNEASESATVLEVRAPDEVGLLHRITRPSSTPSSMWSPPVSPRWASSWSTRSTYARPSAPR